jgi:hypothetical protein
MDGIVKCKECGGVAVEGHAHMCDFTDELSLDTNIDVSGELEILSFEFVYSD